MPRRALPANVHRFHKNPSHLSKADLAAREEIRPRLVANTPPPGLTRDELACWKLYAPELGHLGLLTVLDRHTFWLTVCVPYGILLEARRQLRPKRKDGQPDGRRQGLVLVVDDPIHGGQRRNPAFLIARQALADFRAGCRLFGLDPLDRLSSLRQAVSPIVEDEDEDDEFFGSGLGDAP